MSDQESRLDFINTYMNEILVKPLARINELMNKGDTIDLFVAMRNFVASLPPEGRDPLEDVREDTEGALDAFYKIRGDYYPHTASLRLAFINNPLTQKARQRNYDRIYQVVYEQDLFTRLREKFELQGQGPTKFAIRR